MSYPQTALCKVVAASSQEGGEGIPQTTLQWHHRKWSHFVRASSAGAQGGSCLNACWQHARKT
eukprot:CAMPEP_0181170810 /NCGR_PEP_ID=MMETSP1096-20121128/1566_1 /TAXON_ID=156174 ORGANISM="Chrysochromulina ericina, Strain CCMP281" /NCGR_SAMPLE_ID=MMETSP1096 /ASSEMBLY_ACC=CAM_ASM_000453 /LENGTH=62 /DNA_ID=CAMNT_0023258399 /DNA_START=891 /DNA_END=1079 /DNA_ORIENTATION=+